MSHTIDLVEEKLLDEAADTLLEEDEVYEHKATKLVSAQQLKEKHKGKIKNFLRDNELKQAIGRGFALIRQDIIEVLDKDQLEPFFLELAKINTHTLHNLPPNAQKKIDAGLKNLTYQDLFDFSNGALKQIYTLGCQYFQHKHYAQAVDIFCLITTLNPFVSEFWNAMALCFQAMKEWEKALETFSIACTLNEKDVASHISRAHCCINVERREEAKEEISLAKEIISKNPALDLEWGEYLRKLRSQV